MSTLDNLKREQFRMQCDRMARIGRVPAKRKADAMNAKAREQAGPLFADQVEQTTATFVGC
jgi:hypothetical protein